MFNCNLYIVCREHKVYKWPQTTYAGLQLHILVKIIRQFYRFPDILKFSHMSPYMLLYNRKTFTSKWKKGDVGMAKRFSKKYRNKGWASTTYDPMSRCLSVPDATSIHHCLENHHQYCTILCWIQAVLFQLHGGMVSHMQVLAT